MTESRYCSELRNRDSAMEQRESVTPTPPMHDPEQRVRLRAGLVSLVVGIVLLAVKYLAYLLTDSAAVLSDALESIVNVVAALFALGSLLFAGRPADHDHPYGHGKIEYFSAAFEGGLIAFAAVVIVWYAVADLIRGPSVRPADLGLLLTFAAGVANAALGWYLISVGRRASSLILVADGQHVLTDFWTSLGVVVGLVLVRVTGLLWLDPAVALALGANLAYTGFRLVRRAAGGLLDEEDTDLLTRLVAGFDETRTPGIIRIHRLRAIRAGRFTHIDAHLIVPEYWTVEQAHEVTDTFERRVIAACTIRGEIVFHTDPCRHALCPACDVPNCPIRRSAFVSRPPLTVHEARLTDESFWGLRGSPMRTPGAAAAAR
jgi:cation diffusion facilitator family transporter